MKQLWRRKRGWGNTQNAVPQRNRHVPYRNEKLNLIVSSRDSRRERKKEKKQNDSGFH